jgi:hypothetical protein
MDVNVSETAIVSGADVYVLGRKGDTGKPGKGLKYDSKGPLEDRPPVVPEPLDGTNSYIYFSIDEGVFYIGTTGESVWYELPANQGEKGNAGWTALFTYQQDGTERVVMYLSDYFGGEGIKPTTNIGKYVSPDGFTSDKSQATNFKGNKGDKGDQGDKGDPFTVYKTYPSILEMESDADNVPDGQFVVISSNVEDPDNGRLYIKGEEGFSFITDLSGAQGMKGDKGDKGEQGDKGDQGDQGDKGDKGDKGDQGDKGEQGIQGIQGEQGYSVLNGASDPTTLDGRIGDFYINTTSLRIFGAKTSGGWGVGVDLKGNALIPTWTGSADDAGLTHPSLRYYDGELYRVKSGQTALATDTPNYNTNKWERITNNFGVKYITESDFVIDGFYRSSDGGISSTAGYKSTGIYKCNPGSVFINNPYSGVSPDATALSIAYFDSEGRYLSGVLMSTNQIKFTAPSNAYGVAFSKRTSVVGLDMNVYVTQDFWGLQKNGIVLDYIHTSNSEVYVTNHDQATGVFTSNNHGLTNGMQVSFVQNVDANVWLANSSFTTRVGFANYVVNATENTFQLSQTAGGTPLILTRASAFDLTKWHLESSTDSFTFTNLPILRNFKVFVTGGCSGVLNYYTRFGASNGNIQESAIGEGSFSNTPFTTQRGSPRLSIESTFICDGKGATELTISNVLNTLGVSERGNRIKFFNGVSSVNSLMISGTTLTNGSTVKIIKL